MKTSKATSGARFAYEGLDRVIHERARLSVLTSLMTRPNGLGFGEMKQLCGLTDGNLARHLQVLEEEKMIRLTKDGDAGRALTTARVTAVGRKRFLDYLTILEQVVRDAAPAEQEEEEDGPVLRALTPVRG